MGEHTGDSKARCRFVSYTGSSHQQVQVQSKLDKSPKIIDRAAEA